MLSDDELKAVLVIAKDAKATCQGQSRVFAELDVDSVAAMARELLAVRARAAGHGPGDILEAEMNKPGRGPAMWVDDCEPDFWVFAGMVARYVAYGNGAPEPQRLYSEEAFREALAATYRARGERMVEQVVDDTMRRLRGEVARSVIRRDAGPGGCPELCGADACREAGRCEG